MFWMTDDARSSAANVEGTDTFPFDIDIFRGRQTLFRPRTSRVTGASLSGQDDRAWNHLLRDLWLVRRIFGPLRFGFGAESCVASLCGVDAFLLSAGEPDRCDAFFVASVFLDGFFGMCLV
jgi:hypothetical protein